MTELFQEKISQNGRGSPFNRVLFYLFLFVKLISSFTEKFPVKIFEGTHFFKFRKEVGKIFYFGVAGLQFLGRSWQHCAGHSPAINQVSLTALCSHEATGLPGLYAYSHPSLLCESWQHNTPLIPPLHKPHKKDFFTSATGHIPHPIPLQKKIATNPNT